MYNRHRFERLLNIIILILIGGIFYFAFFSNVNYVDYTSDKVPAFLKNYEEHNIWLIFTKATKKKSPLRTKFHNLIVNLLNVSTVPLKFNIITDLQSKDIVEEEISDIVLYTNKLVPYSLYDFDSTAAKLKIITETMMPHFSSKPGSYYGDVLFFLSLGLHEIAPGNQDKVIMLDCDLYFKQDIALLFKEFNNFKPTALFGLAPELSPVYLHILQKYRKNFKNSTFGEYYHQQNISKSDHPRGFQGYNSGVLLLNLEKIRRSSIYSNLITKQSVEALTKKYKFKGHLGDQDFYTLLGYEYPDLIQTIHCGFNRQLCKFWNNYGYKKIFEKYFQCNHPTIVLHGNCNTKIKKD